MTKQEREADQDQDPKAYRSRNDPSQAPQRTVELRQQSRLANLIHRIGRMKAPLHGPRATSPH